MISKINNLIAKSKKLIPIILIILVSIITYANTFQNKFVWDDPAFFADNILVKTLNIPKIFTSNTVAGAAISSDYYRPITSITFGLDYKIWGLNPFGFHLTNLILHILTALLLFSFLKIIKFNKTLALWVTLFFIVHPVQVEAVTYLSSRGDILYSLLFLISLNLFTLTLYNPNPKLKILKKNFKIPTSLLLILAIITYGLSIFAKELSLAVWPTFIFILIFFKIQKKIKFKELHKIYRAHFITILMLFWESLMYMFLRVYFLNFNNSLNFLGSQDLYSTNIFVRILTFFKIIWLYLGLIFWPSKLYLERNTNIETNFFNPPVFTALLLIIALIFLGIWEFKKTKKLWIFLGIVWISLHIIPVSGIVPMTYLYHENWLYMPIIGLTIILFSTFNLIFPKFNAQKYKKFLNIFGVIILSILIFLTIKQNSTWKDSIALFEHNLKYSQTARLHLNLGNAYMDKGEFDKAISHLNEASKIADFYPQIHFNLGYIYEQQNKKKEAREEYLKTLAIDDNYFYVYKHLINSYIETKEFDKSLPLIDRLNRVFPGDLKLTLLYGKILYISNKKVQAEEQFNKAIQIAPKNKEVTDKINQIRSSEETF